MSTLSPALPLFVPKLTPLAERAPGLLELVREDFATHEARLSEPGFWAVAVHRLGKSVERLESPILRRACDLPRKVLFVAVDWVWGIRIPPSVALGRRVRIWHGGGMLLAARSIGDDVQIRHDTTFGPLRGSQDGEESLPVIEDRVDIGSGVSILGGVVVGHDAVIGPNSVVMRDVTAGTHVLGVPAREVTS